jgi:Protein of unknown function (DUF3108)
MRCAGLMLLAACAGADAMTLPPTSAAKPSAPASEVGLNPGESMAFEVRVAGVLTGEAQLAVGEIGDYEGHRAVVVKSRAATAGVAALVTHIVDEATTWIDMDTGRPLALETLVEQGHTKTTATATFTGNVARITYVRSNEQAPHEYKLDLGAVTVHDAHSAMAQLRGWRATPGATRSVFVVGGRQPWRVDVTYVGEDTIGSAIGNRRAIHFTGMAYRTRRAVATEPELGKPARTFSVWLSDDADRVPLKVTASTELGEIVMDLTEYNR